MIEFATSDGSPGLTRALAFDDAAALGATRVDALASRVAKAGGRRISRGWGLRKGRSLASEPRQVTATAGTHVAKADLAMTFARG